MYSVYYDILSRHPLKARARISEGGLDKFLLDNCKKATMIMRNQSAAGVRLDKVLYLGSFDDIGDAGAQVQAIEQGSYIARELRY